MACELNTAEHVRQLLRSLQYGCCMPVKAAGRSFQGLPSLVCSVTKEAKCALPVSCSAPDAMLIALQAAVLCSEQCKQVTVEVLVE